MSSKEFTKDEVFKDHVISGRKLSRHIRREIKVEVARLTEQYGISPKLVTILVGADPGSQMYVRMKIKASNKAGILSENHDLPEKTTHEELLALIQKLNADREVHGTLVQLPLPKHIDEKAIISAIDARKDVDGFSPASIYRLFYGDEELSSATPLGGP